MYKWCKKDRGQGVKGSSESPRTLEPTNPRTLFIGLLIASVAGISILAFLLWWVPTIGLGNINRALPYVLAVLLIGIILFLLSSASLLALSASGRNVPFSDKLRGILVKLFFPAMLFLGGIFKVEKTKIHKAFIDINNRLVKAMPLKVRPDTFLILMPHCLQFQDCEFKVTKDIENCGECGKCEIVELLHLGREYGIKLFVNTGGTSARKIVAERRPNAVVAVACERDLVSGITDSYPLPVVGISNIRPEGYCVNTHVEIERVKEAVRGFLGSGGQTI
ncbi:MAG: DUF116 domain-containing protein [Deltaproteobacteria bacterium]|nr:DUF116 domain-containing protein [Deltaproteobacteria bacterium]